MTNLADILLLDNPILTKHARSRLRPAQALPWMVIVLVLAACATWLGYDILWIGSRGAVGMLIGMQVLILGFSGAGQINGSLGGAKESGILDFHRVSPLPPGVVALGFFLGAPIREYAAAAVVVPFALFSGASIDPADMWKGVLWVVELEVALLATVWVVHAVTMLGCLTRKRPRGSVAGTVASIVVLLSALYFGAIGIFFGTRWLLDEERALNFFGAMVPWLPWLLIYEVPALGFLGLAVARKTRAERAHAYTKPQAVACLATLTVLVLGGLWDLARFLPVGFANEPSPGEMIRLAAVYGLAMAAMVLAVTITPEVGEYVKGLRRAGREGRRRPGPWSDSGSNRVALLALGLLVLAGGSAVVDVVGREPNARSFVVEERPGLTPAERDRVEDAAWKAARRAMFSRPIAVAVLTVAYFGLGLQYFSLRTRRSGAALTAAFLFVAWLGPILAGSVLAMTAPPGREPVALTIAALSPLPGVALSSGVGRPTAAGSIQLAALAPAITFAFLFNYLLVVTQRKVDRAVRAEGSRAPAPDPLAEAPRRDAAGTLHPALD